RLVGDLLDHYSIAHGGARCQPACDEEPPCPAASASLASSCRAAKNAGGWPRNSPSAVRILTVAMAAPTVAVGRMIDTAGNVRLRKAVGSGMIRLVWKSSPPKGAALRSGKTSPLVGSVSAGALPALSCQVWKC